MKHLYILILIAVLAACATPADRRHQRPNLDLTSTKPAKDVAVCISEKWENTKPFMAFSSPPVNANMRANGYSIAATDISRYGSTSTFALADVTEQQGATAVKFYKQAGGGFGDYEEAVRQCL